MAEGQESVPPKIRTAAELHASPFGKVEQAQTKKDVPYATEFNNKEGGKIFNFHGNGNAWVAQGFLFDTSGELDEVYVEKRLLSKEPVDIHEASKMFIKESERTDLSPVYLMRLKKEAGGKFSIVKRSSVDAVARKAWEEEFRAAQPKTPEQAPTK